MNKIMLAMLLCPMLGIPAQAQVVPAPTSAGGADTNLGGPLMGAYAPASLDAPLVQEARSFIQGHLASMTLNGVTQAYTQVVAGLNVKLVCAVEEEDGTATWQFVAYRSLDGRWHFHSAERVQ